MIEEVDLIELRLAALQMAFAQLWNAPNRIHNLGLAWAQSRFGTISQRWLASNLDDADSVFEAILEEFRQANEVRQFVTGMELLLAHHPKYLRGYLQHGKKFELQIEEEALLLYVAYAQARESSERLWFELRLKLVLNCMWAAQAKVPEKKKDRPRVLTESQEAALNQIVEMGEAHFAQEWRDSPLVPRLTPLIAGPSGCGKSFVTELATERLGAKFMHITFGDWVPNGADRSFEPTVFQIIRLLKKYPRVVVCLDELDKWREDFSNSWGRSCSNEAFKLLDRQLPLEAYRAWEQKQDHAELEGSTEEVLLEDLQARLCIIGIS